jgi:2-oxo-4-hydroxy-4-carboxy-5-ureidoimidazoline decarboxylase
VMTIHDANELTHKEFVLTFSWIFGHRIAEQVSELRPFPSYQFLHHAMKKCIKKLSPDEKLSLIQELPDFSHVIRGEPSSKRINNNEKLRSLSSREYKKFISLNNKYVKKFGFPFVIAMRGHDKESVYEAIRRRVKNTETEEIEIALDEILRMYFYRLRENIQNEKREQMKTQSM